ncbi:MAG: hypothetical protein IKJ72_03320, partial [Mycoplasmataceae bacterium]|nr:hypothetical protein [Mycoplasmataceae bacterium]
IIVTVSIETIQQIEARYKIQNIFNDKVKNKDISDFDLEDRREEDYEEQKKYTNNDSILW